MFVLRTILALIAAAFAALIIWAVAVGDFSAAGQWLTSDPWGLVTLTDLYFGFFMFAVIIAFVERGLSALLWIIPIPVLGNVWVAIWFIWRLPKIARAFA